MCTAVSPLLFLSKKNVHRCEGPSEQKGKSAHGHLLKGVGGLGSVILLIVLTENI